MEKLNKMLTKILSQDPHYNFKKIWKEMDEIEPLTPSVKDSIEIYKDAAKIDSYLFGDYDGYESYKEDP